MQKLKIILVILIGYDKDGRTKAIAFILDKYNAGITILKQNSNANFTAIKTRETIQQDGTKIYTSVPCNN